MNGSTGTSTADSMEQLLDMLHGKSPETTRALALVERLLEQDPCARELQESGAATAAIIERLILPLLSQDPARQQRARALRDCFAQAGTCHAWQTEGDAWLQSAIQAISGGIPVPPPPRSTGTPDPLPRSLLARMAIALQLIGESEAAFQARLARWQGDNPVDWDEVRQLLAQIREQGHRAAIPPGHRRRRGMQETMLRMAGEYAETLTGMGSPETDFSQSLAELRQGEGRLHLRRLRELLRAEGMALQKEARHLRAQQDESRERAEQFKSRIDQLEAALAQARREQFLDPVTGIPDRFAFMAHLHRHLDRSLHLGETFSLLLFHFYEFNQLVGTLQHTGSLLQESGERRVLMAIIQEMRPHLPENAFLARLSAERMVILLPKCSVQKGEAMGALVCRTLEETCFVLDGTTLAIQVSFGCAAFQSGMNVAQMLETTDRLAAAAHGEREEGQRTAQRIRNC